MGDGSSPISLSQAGIRRHVGCQLPDAILHGKRSFRPHSRAVQCLAITEFRVRLFSLLQLVVAPPACKPDQDTFMILFPRLDHLHRVSHRFWRCVCPMPRVSPLHSQVAFRSQASGVVCNIAGVLEVFHRSCLDRMFFPVRILFLSVFRRISFGGLTFYFESAEVIRTVLMRSSNRLPLG